MTAYRLVPATALIERPLSCLCRPWRYGSLSTTAPYPTKWARWCMSTSCQSSKSREAAGCTYTSCTVRLQLLPFKLTDLGSASVDAVLSSIITLQVRALNGQALAAPEAVLPQPSHMVQEPLCAPDPGECAAGAAGLQGMGLSASAGASAASEAAVTGRTLPGHSSPAVPLHQLCCWAAAAPRHHHRRSPHHHHYRSRGLQCSRHMP